MKRAPLALGEAERAFQLEETSLFLSVVIMSPEIEDAAARLVAVIVENEPRNGPRAINNVTRLIRASETNGASAALHGPRGFGSVASREPVSEPDDGILPAAFVMALHRLEAVIRRGIRAPRGNSRLSGSLGRAWDRS
jgi:hypothetical protein